MLQARHQAPSSLTAPIRSALLAHEASMKDWSPALVRAVAEIPKYVRISAIEAPDPPPLLTVVDRAIPGKAFVLPRESGMAFTAAAAAKKSDLGTLMFPFYASLGLEQAVLNFRIAVFGERPIFHGNGESATAFGLSENLWKLIDERLEIAAVNEFLGARSRGSHDNFFTSTLQMELRFTNGSVEVRSPATAEVRRHTPGSEISWIRQEPFHPLLTAVLRVISSYTQDNLKGASLMDAP